MFNEFDLVPVTLFLKKTSEVGEVFSHWEPKCEMGANQDSATIRDVLFFGGFQCLHDTIDRD